jgi:hypothetical protein
MHVNFDTIASNIKKKSYPVIGAGSGRIVFDLDNGYVVKAAKNRKGLEQNKAEHRISTMDHSDIFAKIAAVSDDYHYLVMQKAERILDSNIVCKYYNVRSLRELFTSEKFRNLTKEYDLLYGDLFRRSSWGLVNDKPVIIDYGFTREVKRLYSIF